MRNLKHVPDGEDSAGAVKTYVHGVIKRLRLLARAGYILDRTQAKNFINKVVSSLSLAKVKCFIVKEKIMWQNNKHGSIAHFLSMAKEISKSVNEVDAINNHPSTDIEKHSRYKEREAEKIVIHCEIRRTYTSKKIRISLERIHDLIWIAVVSTRFRYAQTHLKKKIEGCLTNI